MNENGITLPEDLLFMWEYSRYNVEETPENKERYTECWKLLQNILAKKASYDPSILPKDQRPKILGDASGYMLELLNGPAPENITAIGLLTRNFRKYQAKKNDPAGYELDQILREALRSLEKENLIKRDKASLNKNISGNTLFALSEITLSEKFISDYSFYSDNKHKISVIAAKCNDHLEGSRILTLSEARQLVLELLKAFGSWTYKKDLMSAMKNHVPKLLRFEYQRELATEESYDDKPYSTNLSEEKKEEQRIYSFDIQHNRVQYQSLSREIWDGICQISDRSFCLYFLPKIYFRKDVIQADAGDSKRVSEHCQKIAKIFQEKLDLFKEALLEDECQKTNICFVLQKITRNLSGKCMKKGYPPHLYNHNTTK